MFGFKVFCFLSLLYFLFTRYKPAVFVVFNYCKGDREIVINMDYFNSLTKDTILSPPLHYTSNQSLFQKKLKKNRKWEFEQNIDNIPLKSRIKIPVSV